MLEPIPVVSDSARSIVRERLNALIYSLYTRREFTQCLFRIEEQLSASNGQSEYALYIKGMIFRHQGRIDESLLMFQAALALNPRSVENLKQVGRSLYLLGKHKTALEVFTEAEQIDPNDRDLYHNKGMCYLYLKNYEQSITSLQTANEISRQEVTYLQIGRVYRLMGRDEDALDIYLEALELNPESSDLLTTIGLLFLKLSNNVKAFEYLGNALTYDARNAKAILAAGSIIQDNQDMDVALVKYRVAIAQTPHVAQLWNNIGMCFFGKGKNVAAIACLKRGIYLAPFEWIMSYNLGVLHLSTEQYASAFHYFSTAINLQPTYARAYTFLALTLSKLEDFDNACAAYDKSLELADDPLTHLNYAITLFHNDEQERCRRHFEKYERLVSKKKDPVAEDEDLAVQANLLRKLLSTN